MRPFPPLRPLRLASLGLCLLAAGCSSLGNKEPEGSWVEAEVSAPSESVVWSLSLLALEKMNFPRGGSAVPSDRRVVSGWQTNLAPFSRKGYRLRAELEMEPLSPGQWKLRSRVAKQINEAQVAPLDASRAEWKWQPDDTVQAQILLQHITRGAGSGAGDGAGRGGPAGGADPLRRELSSLGDCPASVWFRVIRSVPSLC